MIAPGGGAFFALNSSHICSMVTHSTCALSAIARKKLLAQIATHTFMLVDVLD
jgi:hypothetical protein